ncbi:MAG: cache domain-containing protein [Lachnospiraceae bacterium]
MKKKSILFKLLGVVGACLAAVLMIVGAVIMLIQYQNRVVDMQNEQLASIAENVATMTELVTREYINDLESLSSTSAFTEADDALTRGNSEVMSRFIDSYYYKKKGILGGIFLTDPTGKELVGTTDFPAVIYSYSMGDTDTGVSVVVREDEGRNCYLELSVETENQNRLIYLLDARELYAQTAAHTKVGDKGYVMIKDNNGRIIMHPVEDQIGIDVLEDRKKSHPDFDFSDLEVLIAKQNSGQSGIERYNSYWWADEVPRRVEKISAYTPAWVGDGFLVISAVMDYEEIAGRCEAALSV